MKVLATTSALVTGGRDGRAVSPDGYLDVPLAMPKALGGSGQGTNPEQLFAAGFAACFNSSIRYVARGRGLDAGDVSINSEVSLTLADDGAYGVAVAMQVTVPGLKGALLDEVIAEAKRVCAYTNATRGNVDLTLTIA